MTRTPEFRHRHAWALYTLRQPENWEAQASCVCVRLPCTSCELWLCDRSAPGSLSDLCECVCACVQAFSWTKVRKDWTEWKRWQLGREQDSAAGGSWATWNRYVV